jgi:hypothetical protein
MARKTEASDEPTDVLYRIKRGLAGYVSYLAACEMNEAFSEYVLYEPVLRILTARGYVVECEYECPGIKQPEKGDKKKIDFYAKGHNLTLAIEVKWARSAKPNISQDTLKLSAIKQAQPGTVALLCVFGRKSHLDSFTTKIEHLKERGKRRVANLGKTKYGCRFFELKSEAKPGRVGTLCPPFVDKRNNPA